jgi:hypothetical protein
MSTDADALAMIDQFEKDGSGQGFWQGIGKEELVLDLEERVKDKDGLNQHLTNWCTVAALVHSLLCTDPVSFVRLAIDLYTKGRGTWRGKLIWPSYELQRDPPPDGQVYKGTPVIFNRADWIVMSSIRNTINPADEVTRTSPRGTFLRNIEQFVHGMGYTKIESDFSENTLSKDKDNALRASTLLGQGFRVLININACMLYDDTQADWGGVLWGVVPKPNHTVQLIEKIEFYASDLYSSLDCRKIDQDGNVLCSPPLGNIWVPAFGAVRFAVYTWGIGHWQVPYDAKKPLALKDFLWNYYGYLAFRD